ncbi:MAG: hypothetical protein FWD28_08455 [Treponema sp.]|nr:hypothetical protein [Treponema sp.]
MKKLLLTFAFAFILLSGICYAQNISGYLIPRQIYVGDPAVLVLTLPPSSQNENIVLASQLDSNIMPSDPNIDFHRILLERRIAGSRLMIEFTAFTPGTHVFPDIEIGGEQFTGLQVRVNSLIENRSTQSLAGAAAVLAMPGTAIMLYGSLIGLIVFILLTIWFIFKGRAVLNKLYQKWKRYRLFASIRKTEKRLQRALNKNADKRQILDKLSGEFREFLSVLTEKNCRSMTAREFDSLVMPEAMQNMPLSEFFYKCDELRFSGAAINPHEISKLLGFLRAFLDTLEGDK